MKEVAQEAMNKLWNEAFPEPKKQTAVEWLIDELLSGKLLTPSLIEQAKEMKKQQQGYSEEEVLTILHKRDMYKWEEHFEVLSLNEWFKKFKKK